MASEFGSYVEMVSYLGSYVVMTSLFGSYLPRAALASPEKRNENKITNIVVNIVSKSRGSSIS